MTTIDAVLKSISNDHPHEYLHKFMTRFNKEANGALAVVFDSRKGDKLFFTGSDPIAEDIAEYSEQQTRRHNTGEQTIDAYAVEETDQLTDTHGNNINDVHIYISFVSEDGESAIKCANLLEKTIRGGLPDYCRASIFRTDNVALGEDIDQTLNDRVNDSDLAIVLLSYNYLNETIEVERVCAVHPHPVIVMFEKIHSGVSIQPLDRMDIMSGQCFVEVHKTEGNAEQDFANHVLDIILRELTRNPAFERVTSAPPPDDLAKVLAKRGHLDPTTVVVPARATIGAFEELKEYNEESHVNGLKDTSHAVDRLLSWACGADDERLPLCALLGNLGTGKTTSAVLLTRRLLELRKTGEQVPLPIYFDLRDLSPTTLKDFGLRTLLTQLLANSSLSTITVDNVLATVQDELTLVIFDGLDEVLVHLSPGDGQRLTRSLLEVLNLGKQNSQEEDPRTRLLLSCRTQFFRSIEEEFSFFDGQGRENKRGRDYLVLTLLPFDEDQIREYLRRNIPEANTDRLLETIRSVHNLRELASQPVLLNMIRQVLLTIDKDLSTGHKVRSVDLYERFAGKWLQRDDGKHSLIPEHKILLMTHLAWQVWRSGSRTWSADWMEEWMLQFLHTHPDMELHYPGRIPDQWKQDFRTATFLARRGDDFSFAHSSLLEYFLAKRLTDSLEAESEDEALAAWDITRPSDECFAFFAELIDRFSAPTQRQALARLEHIGAHGSTTARENIFAYTLQAIDNGAPHPRPYTLTLSDTDLSSWSIGSEHTHIDLTGVSLCRARLDDTHIRNTCLNNANVTGASLRRALIEHSSLSNTILKDSDLSGAIFRFCNLGGASLDDALRYRTQLLHTIGYHHELSGLLTSPLTENTSLHILPKVNLFGEHFGIVSAVAWSPDTTHILTASNNGTVRIWDTTTGENTLTLTDTDHLTAVAWSPDGTHILTASREGTVQIWDTTTGNNTQTLTSRIWVTAATWSPDGTHILTASRNGMAQIWDATTGNNTQTLTSGRWATAATWSPDGTHILTASREGTVQIWDATTGNNTQTLTSGKWITSAQWSPDGTHILTASRNGMAQIWDAKTGKQVRFTIAGLSKGECAVLSPDQTQVIGASPYAWRWLGRYAKHPDGSIERVPVEIDGPLPPLSHGGETTSGIEG